MKYKLNSREITSLLVNLISVKLLFTYPRYIVERCLNGAWLSVLIYTVAAGAIFAITQLIYLKTGRTTILMQAEVIGGKIFRMLTGVAVSGLLMLNIAPMIRAFPEAIKTALLQDTPMLIIVALLAVGVAVGAGFGIEALGRAASFLSPIAGIFILGFFVLLVPYFETTNLFPCSVKSVIYDGTSSLSIFADIFVLCLITPYAEDMTAIKKSGLTAIVISGITGFMIILAYCLVYPYPVSARFIVPMYQLTRIVKIGTYFQRLEAVFEFVWSISIMIYTATYLFIICDTFRQSFALTHHKPLVFPVLVILLRLVFWEESYTEALRSNFVVSAVLYPVFYIIPLLYGLIYLIKKKRCEQK